MNVDLAPVADQADDHFSVVQIDPAGWNRVAIMGIRGAPAKRLNLPSQRYDPCLPFKKHIRDLSFYDSFVR
jgi:hypothetical protein